jgi:pilus assembly protein CpaB
MQNRRALIFFAFAILFGVAAAFTAHRALESRVANTPEAAPIETVEVVITRTDQTTGSVLTAAALTTVDWPKEFAPQGIFVETDMLHGRVLRHALAAGEPVLDGALLPEGSAGGLLSVIAEDKRAVSVKVDQIIGVAGFVSPGARVDVLGTVRDLRDKDKLPYTKSVLQDVRVLAIDQKMEEAETGQPELVSVVTLEVEPKDAEKLIYSAHEGRLQLALRSPSDHETVKTAGVSFSDILARRRTTSKGRRKATVQIVSGSSVSQKSY